MLKLIREGSHSYPWLLKSIMGVIALTFLVTMGWWGFGEQQTGADDNGANAGPHRNVHGFLVLHGQFDGTHLRIVRFLGVAELSVGQP